ncbi:phytanoyl-CoA dioxygenase family protein [Pseudomonas sp.]|uniref:phytanoyl-CoA dioxygenase family protein n=1 Tax=Pseudomonas sp. TaxID=306 RepID=UPI002617DFA6|nr:phytanoyl-CoA dioxygenase family protein [Pseudomonas sp.]
MDTSRTQFQQQGFAHLDKTRANLDLSRIESALAEISQRALSHRADNVPGLVVVTEASNAEQLCRLEYLTGSSPYYAQELVPSLAQLIEQHLGHPVNLFKDKCNFKHPGGGAFTPHQDITAYRHFGSNYQVTAAVLLDAAVKENGALEVATHWDLAPEGAQLVETPRGPLPQLPSYQGGTRNGDIDDLLCAGMRWQRIDAAPGDVILFDSYVPHRSSENRSSSTRRILFFTFNLACEGDFYHHYYRTKWATPDNPIFHVSTPTLHSARQPAPAQCPNPVEG